jgi:hypothetical protein
MSEAYECDRCGELFEGEPWLSLSERHMEIPRSQHPIRRDFCYDCGEKYDQFKKGELK